MRVFATGLHADDAKDERLSVPQCDCSSEGSSSPGIAVSSLMAPYLC